MFIIWRLPRGSRGNVTTVAGPAEDLHAEQVFSFSLAQRSDQPRLPQPAAVRNLIAGPDMAWLGLTGTDRD
jgi:hypothetical protein